MEPITEESESGKQQRKYSAEKKNQNNNNQPQEYEIRQVSSFPNPNVSFPCTNSAYQGPMLPNPFQGIPGNPIHQNVQGMSSNPNDSSASNNFVCRGGIFD